MIHQLATCAWVKDGHPLCLIDDSGTGKSHLLIGLGTAAAEAEAGYRVRYTLASKLVNEFVEAPRSPTGSRSPARSSRPAPSPTVWLKPGHNEQSAAPDDPYWTRGSPPATGGSGALLLVASECLH